MTIRMLLVCSTPGHLNHLTDIGDILKNDCKKSDVRILYWFMTALQGSTSDLKEFQFPSDKSSANKNLNQNSKNTNLISARFKIYFPRVGKWIVLNLIGFPLFYFFLMFSLIGLIGKSSREGGCKLDRAILNVWHFQERLAGYFWSISKDRLTIRSISVLNALSLGIFRMTIYKSASKEILDDLKPSVVILPEFNIGYFHNLISDWCHRNNVPLLVIPYTTCGREEWSRSNQCKYYFKDAFLFNWLLKKAFPLWIYESEREQFLLPFSWFLMCQLYGFVPDVPWVSNSTQSRGIFYAADGEFIKLFYEGQGLDTQSWQIIGSLSNDRISMALSQKNFLRQNFAERYGLCPEKKWILIALPPDQTDLKSALDGQTYADLISQMVQDLKDNSGSRYEILIKLHPRTDLNNVIWIQKNGVTICSDSTDKILALSDLFVASSSATIRWAVNFSIPVINYDVYQYNYSDYNNCPGVIQVNDRNSYLRILHFYLHQPRYLDTLNFELKKNQALTSDGLNSRERLLIMIDNILSILDNDLLVKKSKDLM